MPNATREEYDGFSLGEKDDVRTILIHPEGDSLPEFQGNVREELIGYPRGPYSGLELLAKDFMPNYVAGYYCGKKIYGEHFEITGEVKVNSRGVTLFRVRALQTFAIIYIPDNRAFSSSFFRVAEAGELGGWVSDPLQVRYGWVFDEGEYSGKHKLDGAVMDNAVVATEFSVTQFFSFDKDTYLPERYWVDNIGLPVHTVVRGECIVLPSGGVWNSLISGKIIVKNGIVCRVSEGFGNFCINGRLDGTYNFFVFESPWSLSNAFRELWSNGSQLSTKTGLKGKELSDICSSGLNKMSRELLEKDLNKNQRSPYLQKGLEDQKSFLEISKKYGRKIWENDPGWNESPGDSSLADQAQEVEGEFLRTVFDDNQEEYEKRRNDFYQK